MSTFPAVRSGLAKIIWIASYPRSGNTWVRFLLAHLMVERVESSARLLELIPDIHRSISGGQLYGPATALIKTHWAWSPDLPLREDTVGVVYLVRNPLDVLASALDYRLLRPGASVAGLSADGRAAFARQWIDQFIARGAEANWLAVGMGSWSENVASWTAAPLPYPRLVIRYEDLSLDAAGELRRICRFLRFDRGEDAIGAAVERSSFAALQALEEQEIRERRPGIFHDAPSAAGHAEGRRFISRGEVGSGERLLSAEQRAAALARFGPVMRRFGYLPPDADGESPGSGQ